MLSAELQEMIHRKLKFEYIHDLFSFVFHLLLFIFLSLLKTFSDYHLNTGKMILKPPVLHFDIKKYFIATFVHALIILFPIQAQVKYLPHDYCKDAGVGIDRVARFYTAFYESKPGQNDNEIRWVQVDLDEKKKIDGIKLLPFVDPRGWGYVQSTGFPARFKVEVSDDPDFSDAIMYEDRLREDFRDPNDEVITFTGKEVRGRYVRLTASKLRQQRLALTKIVVLSNGKDIAVGCEVSDSEPGDQGESLLTRPERPQGEGVVTDNPKNIIPVEQWKPVPYKAHAPKKGVVISEGLFKTAMENNISYLLNSFTFDELVRNFRIKAGKPVQALPERLSNFWFLDLPGQEAGRFLMGAGNTLRWIENPTLRERMNQVVDVIDECKEPDGYIMAYPKNKIFSGEYGAYVRSWVTHGLIEAGYAGNEKAFPLLRGFYDWFNASCFLPEMLRRTGQGTQGIIPSTRMYFTPVGKPEDILVVQRYFQENYWMEQLTSRDPKAIWQYPYDRPHNYLLTGTEPYLDLYRATGDSKYLDAAEGAWELFHDNWLHIGGSLAICEGVVLYPPKSYYLHRSTGELCGSVFWTFLNQRFHLLYPEEEKYVAEIEKSIYNNLLANQVADKGFRYHSNLVGHKDLNGKWGFAMSTCCEGQGTRMLGALPEFIFSTADDGIYVNLFSQASIQHKTKSGTIILKMITQFPYDNKVDLTVSTENSLESRIRIRIPSWSAKKIPVRINGKLIAQGNPGTYLTLNRQWKDGDKISFSLPMNFRMTEYSGEEKAYHGHHALEFGPLLMAYVSLKGEKEKLSLPVSTDKLLKSLKPVPGKSLHYTVGNTPDIVFMPYFEVQDETFTCFP